MSKILNGFVKIIKAFYNFLDKRIITPISRLIFLIARRFKGNSNQVEKILNRPNALLYLALFFSFVVFFLVDKQVINLVETEAEILSNQPVTVLYNKEAYVVEGLVDKVDIILTGRKSAIYLAKQLGEHELIIDLTDYEASDKPIHVAISYNQSVDNISYKLDPSFVTVTIKKKVSERRSVTCEVLNENKMNEKLSVNSIELEKKEVVVKGSADALEQIATVKALVDLNNSKFTEANTYTVDNIPLVAYDSAGKLLENVEIVPSTVSANITLNSYSASVPLKVQTTGELLTGKAISSITINGQSSFSVSIYGDKEIIDSIKSVPVIIDVSNQGNSGSKNYNVSIDKPSGVRSISAENAKIVVSFGDEQQRTLTIGGGNFDTNNTLASGLRVNIASDEPITINVKGVQSVIDSYTEDKISAYVDLTGYKAGEYEVELKFKNDDPRVQIQATKKVKISISVLQSWP